MNVVPFYLAVAALLASIYLFFKPLHVEIDAPEELAQIELNGFTIYEVSPRAVKTILAGERAQRFEDRYVVVDINLTDRSHGYRDNMQAHEGVYRNGIVTLDEDVLFHRNDGSWFTTQHALYDQNRSIVRTYGSFIFWRGTDYLEGQDLFYDIRNEVARAKKVRGIYEIKEKM
jgi:hypothetical protein